MKKKIINALLNFFGGLLLIFVSILVLGFFESCAPRQDGVYTVEVTYQDGKVDTISFEGDCCRLTEKGCLYGGGSYYFPACGVRTFRVLSIK